MASVVDWVRALTPVPSCPADAPLQAQPKRWSAPFERGPFEDPIGGSSFEGGAGKSAAEMKSLHKRALPPGEGLSGGGQ